MLLWPSFSSQEGHWQQERLQQQLLWHLPHLWLSRDFLESKGRCSVMAVVLWCVHGGLRNQDNVSSAPSSFSHCKKLSCCPCSSLIHACLILRTQMCLWHTDKFRSRSGCSCCVQAESGKAFELLLHQQNKR